MEPNPSDSSAVGTCELCLTRQNLIETSWNPKAGVEVRRKLCARCLSIFSNKTDQLATRAINAAHSNYLEWEQQQRVANRMNQRQFKMDV